MIDSIPMIVLLGAFSGAIFGRYYRPVFVFLYDKVYILLKGLLTNPFLSIVSMLFAIVSVFLFALWGNVFSLVISDENWVYFYRPYFVGIMVGVFLLRLSSENKF
ncbi:hypothetical protein [Acinetobacter nosocomialis]|uniref:hypothetical protein n=1 Tax=Acinetobacter nosocomialis TaxID=106654 RepID=UPI00124FB5DD|nr:hypothetical protein [Acinetobacter nosocomialis]MBP1483446.1 hypothetical protein [Acinetobacter nosocomialis]